MYNIVNFLPYFHQPLWDLDKEDSLVIKAIKSLNISLYKYHKPYDINIKYKYNNQWISTTSNNIVNLAQNQQVYLKNTTELFSKDNSNYYYFNISNQFEVLNELNALVNGKDKILPYQYYGLFKDNIYLKSINNLKLHSNTADFCYDCMFQGCTALTSIPQNLLPATTLATNCYAGMFQNCTNLTSIPANLLVAYTMGPSCYNSMFQNCTSLTSANTGKASNLIGTSCMANMFKGCINLNKIEVNFTDWKNNRNATTNWVDGVASIGQFICPAALPHTSQYFDSSHIPPGWTVITK